MAEALLNILKPIFKIAFASAFLSQIFPQKISHQDFRGISVAKVTIKQDMKSPAMGALIDVRNEFMEPELEGEIPSLQPWGNVTLNAGKESAQLLEIIRPSSQKILVADANVEVNSQLSGLVISQSIPKSGQKIAHQPQPQTIEQVALFDEYGGILPIEVRKQQLLAATDPQSVQQPTFHEKAERLVNEALEKKEKEQNSAGKTLQSTTGNKIYIAKNNFSAKTKDRMLSHASPGPSQSQQVIWKKAWEDSHGRRLLLSGFIRLFDGLAYSSSLHELSITRVFEGKTQESGKVWLRDARFEISVEQAKGYLIAELHDIGGNLLGYSELNLEDISVETKQIKVDDLELALKPVQRGARVHVISGYSFKNNILAVDESQVYLEPFGTSLQKDGEGYFIESNIENDSNILVRAEAKEHWPTLSRISSGVVATVRVFHNSMIRALIDIVSHPSERKTNSLKGVIWGRVTSQGRPISGAQVELADFDGGIHFLNDFYLPDSELKTTSPNGLFAVVGLDDNIHSVRVTYKGKTFPSQVVATRQGHVSYIEVNFQKDSTINLNVVDAFQAKNELDASIRSLGSDQVIDGVVKNQSLQVLSADHAFHFMEADAGENYALMRVEEPLNMKSLTFPMIQLNWLQKIQTAKKVNRDPYSGIIVGWYPKGQTGDLFLNDGDEFSQNNLTYFDETGDVVRDARSAVGVVLFNVDLGQNSLTFVPDNKNTVSSKSVIVDEEFVSSVMF